MILYVFLIYCIITNSNGCAPTAPVVTTTVSPNVTTTTFPTTTVVSNVSTTTVETTTLVDNCCQWPLPGSGVNTVSPLPGNWNQCNQSITFTCRFSNSTTGSVGFAVNFTEGVPLTSNQVVLAELTNNRGASLTCDTTTRLWSVNGTSAIYSNVTCAYSTNGTWVFGTQL